MLLEVVKTDFIDIVSASTLILNGLSGLESE